MATKTKKTLTKNYGSFNLEGLMVKAKAKRIVLKENELANAAKTKVLAEKQKKRQEDLLAYQLCQRACICEATDCKWVTIPSALNAEN